ncbi:NUDIX domain-containing protein [Phytoactinopolyspora halotolerans]|uniref:NUDIX hydrolase n=1 Tax=Phytoactinopolyspora halotolerans TaxID=1981512 RepID=A0A6L9SAP7_9ACTN|nr:NUDIX hydrolase [Phytoactinopolyspora halotolerans]NEE01070.1 NUDIX hydrolase [Phytoactinopolyspora halotolerans]
MTASDDRRRPFFADLPAQSAAAGMLITDENGRSLLVRTVDREGLVLPGGVVEEGESPAAAAEREVLEETGLVLPVTRLLVVQHKPATDSTPASLMFVFDTERVASGVVLRLQEEEIADALWLDPPTAIRQHTDGGRSRLAAALRARNESHTFYMDATRILDVQHDG